MRDFYSVSGRFFETNSYVLPCGEGNCIVIDCDGFSEIDAFLSEKQLTVVALLLTHGHFDHCAEAALFREKGAKIYICREELPVLSGEGNLGRRFHRPVIPFTPDVLVSDGDEFKIGSRNIKVLHTPGHTLGSVCYLIDDKYLFSGDTLFNQTIGRTDFPTGNAEALKRSVREKLFSLEKNYEVFPGHGIPTTLFFEKENNVYV